MDHSLSRSKEAILLAVIIGLSGLLRLYALNTQSLWFDELLSVAIGRLSLGEVITSPASIDPPLFYMMLHFWLGIARDDVTLRLLPVLFGIAAMLAVYVLTRHLFEMRAGFIAALFGALSQFQIFYSHEVRMYSLLVFLSALAIWTYSRAQNSRNWRDWIVFMITMTLALYTHNYAGLTLVALDMDTLWRWRHRSGDLGRMVVANVMIGLVFLPWLGLLFQKLTWLVPALWLTPPTPLHMLLTLYTFIFGYTLSAPASIVAMCVLVAVVMFIAVASVYTLRRGNPCEQASVRLTLLTLLVPLLLTFSLSQWKPVYLDRLLLETAPAFYALLGWGVVASERRIPLRLSMLIALPLMVWASGAYLTQTEHARPPVRDVIAYVAQHRAPDELIVHTSPSTFLGGRYYDPSGRHILLYHPADQWLTPSLLRELRVPFVANARQLIEGEMQFWVIVALDHIPEEQRAEKAELDRWATITQQTEIGGIAILHYMTPINGLFTSAYPPM